MICSAWRRLVVHEEDLVWITKKTIYMQVQQNIYSENLGISARDAAWRFNRQNYLIWIFTHLKLCLADAIHNFKWVKLFRFDKMEVNCCQILLVDVTFYLQHV